MQRYKVYLYLYTALPVSGGISTHHQEHTQLYLQHWHLSNRYCYLPLSWKSWDCSSNFSMIATGSSNGLTSASAVDTVVCAPDDGTAVPTFPL